MNIIAFNIVCRTNGKSVWLDPLFNQQSRDPLELSCVPGHKQMAVGECACGDEEIVWAD